MDPRPPSRPVRRPMFTPLTVLLAGVLGSTGCGSGTVRLPPPRPIIVTSGKRLRADPARMDSIYAWLEPQNRNIEEDPTFLIKSVPAARESLPWQDLQLTGDTATYQYDRAHPDITTPMNVYAHLHLMKKMGRLNEWLPELADAEGFELERAIAARMADVWLLGRAAYDAPAYGPLDELMYADEAGYLDQFLLVARSEEFAEEWAEWERDRPAELEAYRIWFRDAFNREPPGMREATTGQGR